MKWSRSVVSDSLPPRGLVAYQAPLSMDSPGKNTGVDSYFLLQGSFPTQGSNPGLPHCRQTLNLWATRLQIIKKIFFSWTTHTYCPSVVAQSVKNWPQCRRPGFDPWVEKIPWRRKWKPIPVSLPGKSHAQRSLVGYSKWGHKELGTTDGQTHPH